MRSSNPPMAPKRDEGAPGRLYYRQRAGASAPRLSFEEARRCIVAVYTGLEGTGWFDEWFGKECVDSGHIAGEAGTDPATFIFTRLWLPNMWPLAPALKVADQITLFSVIELLFDCVSEPFSGWNHPWNGCGMHWEKFDRERGRIRWREEVNRVLQHLEDGWELSSSGEVQRVGEPGVRELMDQPLPSATSSSDREKVAAAVRKYRHFSTPRVERIEAVRNLADVLERYRERVKSGPLSEDERELFLIANRFAIRHYKETQKSDYSDEWLDWLFHLYLSSVHLMLRLVHGNDATNEPEPDSIPF